MTKTNRENEIDVLTHAMRKTLSFTFRRGWDAYADLSKRPGFTGNYGYSDWQVCEHEVVKELELNLKAARAALLPQPRTRKRKGTDATQSKDSEEK